MKQSKIRILVADDHPMVRDGIVSVVEIEKDMRVVAQASDGLQTVTLAKKHLPDIVLLDLRMPVLDGLEAIAQIQSLHLPGKVIVLTTFESERDVQLAIAAGSRAYLLKDAPRTTLVDTIREVHRGRTCIPASVGKKLVENMSHPNLSTREIETLRLVAEGKSNRAIADDLEITEGTVKTHMKNILHKLDVPGRTAAVRRAVTRGLIQLA